MADEIKVPLILDAGEILMGLAEVKESMISIAKTAGLTEGQIQDAMRKGAVEAGKYEERLRDAVEANQALITAAKKTDQATAAYDETAKKVDELGDQLNEASKKTDELSKKGKRVGDDFSSGVDKAKKGLGGLKEAAGVALKGLVALFAVDRIIAFGQAVFQATATFQKYQAQLKTALGSYAEANKALASLTEFAKKTPYELNELTEAYVKFANRGIKLTTDQLTKLGDLASSQGKSFLQLTEAVLDAGTGEFERLKEFGIKARQQGENVILTFKGQTVEVKKNEQAIQDAIIAMGAYNGIAGGMAEQSKTLGGQLSNTRDAFDQLASSIGQRLAPLFGAVLGGLNDFLGGITDFVKDKSLEELKTQFDSQVDSVINLETNIRPLAERYDELQKKTNLSKTEQDEMRKIVSQVAGAIPEAVTAFDEYGNAISISTDRVYAFIQSQQDALKYQNRDLIEKTKNDIKDLQQEYKIIQGQLEINKSIIDKANSGTLNGAIGISKEGSQEKVSKYTQDLKAVGDKIKQAQSYLEQINGDFIEKRKKQVEADRKLTEEERKTKEAEAKKSEEAAKAEANRKKAASEAARAERERLSAIREQLSLEAELNQARLNQMADGYQKEVAIEEERNRSQLANLNYRLLTAKKGSQEEAVINQLIQLENQDHYKRLLDIQTKYVDQAVALEREAKRRIKELTLTGQDAELDALSQSTQSQISQTAKDFPGAKNLQNRLRIIQAIMDNDAQKRKEITQKYTFQEIDQEEQRNTLLAKLQIDNEEARETAILMIRKDALEKKLSFLKQSGKAENDVDVLNIEALIKELNTKIQKAVSSNGGAFSVSDFFKKAIGFDKLDGDTQKAIEDSINGVINNVTKALVDGADAQIAAKRRVVDELTSQIDEIEYQLDRERQLQEQGYANNVATKEKELQDLKAKREQALKDEEEAQKKRANLAKLQIAIDSVGQISDLITSSTQIFKGVTKVLPVIGVPIAIGLIATMFGAFAAAKIQAFKLAGQTKYEKGGIAGGKSHRDGGNKYMSMDGNDADVIEIERGEYITNKKSTRKYKQLLDAINSDELSSWNFSDLMHYVDPNGSRMRSGLKSSTIQLQHNLSVAPAGITAGKELAEIRDGIQDLVTIEKTKSRLIDMGSYYLEKVGSITRKIKKS